MIEDEMKSRLSYNITKTNKERLKILSAFATLNREEPKLQDLLNDAIEQYFLRAYEKYSATAADSDILLRAMQALLPADIQDESA